ncbi:hypothetical protein [Anabaenopsis elenkinii]|uniref:Uncharacterized protein n=1 Tax=Anabaenopsis elenkinii CCIBt3563 TaxID=2779889 RepID=A0A7S6RF45_9CYAN|nr:hypothetical protein [Anabaenopsis elenkinii]QOV23262.1 hypothetical protein IM676_02690 [Anabaenopsis elenkinii CCIBt3563]QOV23769.1 hypothetical protein IM676_05640 [Anabaenopsis elenkinii CCIBt3563]
MLLAAFTIAALIVTQHQDFAYTGVTVWALVAIAIKHWQNSLLRNLALIFAIALVAIITINSVKPQRPQT